MYGIHPSARLVSLYREKPFQGQNPERAKIIVVGTDANYADEISEHPFFSHILEYHSDGVTFWKKHGRHHPFMLPSFPFNKNKFGRRYHMNFEKLGFGPEDAEQFTFVEVLDVPTIGNTNEAIFLDMLRPEHLDWIEEIVFNENRKFVLINQRLRRTIDMIHKKMGSLSRLRNMLNSVRNIGEVYGPANLRIFNGYSFSHSVSDIYLGNLATEIRRFLRDA